MYKLSECKVTLVSQLKNNQLVLNTDRGQFFQSYETLIAFKPLNGDTPVLSKDWACSATTLKYVKEFLGMNYLSKKDIQNRIKAGSIILVNCLK